MIIISAALRFDPTGRDEVIAELRNLTNISRQDQGCAEYTWSEDLEKVGTFRLIECWRSQADLDAHLATPHLDDFRDRVMSQAIEVKMKTYLGTEA